MVKTVPTYCDDWSCPSMWSCRHAWGRAEEYWTFDAEAPVKFDRRKRRPDVDCCYDYERDKPRAWLKGIWDHQVPMDPPVRGFTLYAIDGGRA